MGQKSLGAMTKLHTPLHYSSVPRTPPSTIRVEMNPQRLGCPLAQEGDEDTGIVPLPTPHTGSCSLKGSSPPEGSVVMLQGTEAAGGSMILEAFSKQNDYSLKQLPHTTSCAPVPSPGCLWALLTQLVPV